jgi:hypothetical protein
MMTTSLTSVNLRAPPSDSACLTGLGVLHGAASPTLARPLGPCTGTPLRWWSSVCHQALGNAKAFDAASRVQAGRLPEQLVVVEPGEWRVQEAVRGAGKAAGSPHARSEARPWRLSRAR